MPSCCPYILFPFSGMMNCRPGKSFSPNDQIGDYLANSKNGVIFVSFGSVLKGSLMTVQNKRILIRAFASFPEYDFLWKWDEVEMLGKPDNVLLAKWLPQQDVLAHPNLKLFVTHAGQSSFQEALCHKKVKIYSLELWLFRLKNDKVEGLEMTLEQMNLTKKKLLEVPGCHDIGIFI